MVKPPTYLLALSVALATLVGFLDVAQLAKTKAPSLTQSSPIAQDSTPSASRVQPANLALFGAISVTAAKPSNASAMTRARIPKSSAGYQLTGTIASSAAEPRRALIGSSEADQRPYSEGDQMPDGARVLSIEAKRVVLSRDGQPEALELPDPDDIGGQTAERALPDTTQIQPLAEPARSSPSEANPPPLPVSSKPKNILKERIARAKQAAAARGEAGPIFEPPP